MKKTTSATLNWLRKTRVAVLFGGTSGEREVSKRTGSAVLKAFQSLGCKAIGIDAQKDLALQLARNKIGFCFIALHGKGGEDGTVQGLCEIMSIPYSGSGVLASALSMDKAASKILFIAAGVPTAAFQIIESREHAAAQVKLKLPFVAKPVDGGSALGVSIVRKASEIRPALASAARLSSRVLIESFIEGVEVTAPVLGDETLPIIEIVPKGKFYDYKSKYVKGMSDHILPARISESVARKIHAHSLSAHAALGCRAFSRTDFIVDRRGNPWALELNSIPGMTETSLFPEAARAVGYSFPEMILKMVELSRAEK